MSRLELQATLETILGTDYVYFQPPESLKLRYPCIIYSLSNIQSEDADNKTYRFMRRYTVMYITDDPDDDKADEFLALPYCSFDRQYVSENMYHNVYTIYNK